MLLMLGSWPSQVTLTRSIHIYKEYKRYLQFRFIYIVCVGNKPATLFRWSDSVDFPRRLEAVNGREDGSTQRGCRLCSPQPWYDPSYDLGITSWNPVLTIFVAHEKSDLPWRVGIISFGSRSIDTPRWLGHRIPLTSITMTKGSYCINI